MKLTKVSKLTTAVSILFLLCALGVSQKSTAGECKVSRPSDDVLADALNMADKNEEALAEITAEYEKTTGKQIEIVIVARAGQNLENQVVLRDVMGKSPLTLENIYKAAYADSESYSLTEGGRGTVPDFVLMKNVIAKRFKDPERSMDFSHVGFMIRNHPYAPPLKPGELKMWRAFHMLRPCKNDNPQTEFEKLQQKDLNRPFLWDEGSFNFFADNPYELKIHYIVPTPEIQARLMEIVFDDQLVYTLNSRFYNAAANWKNEKESNSNQWVLEILAAATQPKNRIRTRAEAQKVLAQMNYMPTKILFTGQQALANIPGAHQIAPFVTYHASEQPFYFKASIGEVISVNSVEEFLGRNGLLFGTFETEPIEKTANLIEASKPPKPAFLKWIPFVGK